MTNKLTKYKLKRLATESFRNGLRLHFDSIELYRIKSFPSACQLSILALEEFSKSYWIEHYYYTSITNNGFPEEGFEQGWLKLLYSHTKKHKAFVGWGWEFEYNDSFVKSLRNGKIEQLKQDCAYVGLKKIKNKIETKGRISTPFKIKDSDSRKYISVLNDYLIDRCDMKSYYESHFDIEEKDELLDDKLYQKLNDWNFRSGLRKQPLFRESIKKAAATNS
jgi:AbiV family abortive infection protein